MKGDQTIHILLTISLVENIPGRLPQVTVWRWDSHWIWNIREAVRILAVTAWSLNYSQCINKCLWLVVSEYITTTELSDLWRVFIKVMLTSLLLCQKQAVIQRIYESQSIIQNLWTPTITFNYVCWPHGLTLQKEVMGALRGNVAFVTEHCERVSKWQIMSTLNNP